MNIPTNVSFILQTLEAAGYEAFIVGGCVRDIICGVVPKDWDIATSATPDRAKPLFRRTIDTGVKHGTITVLIDKQTYEVTTYRIDGEYLDNRRPETVTFTGNIEDDLARRDFTINAIAYNPARGFVDPFGGREDIARKMIRCVGEPAHRFQEDALRMLRAIRFAGTTGFSICSKTLEAIAELAPNLQNISPERIREELGKLITSPNPQAAEFLYTTGLMPYIVPAPSGPDVNPRLCEWLTSCPPREPMRMALFLHWAGENCENTLRALRFDNGSIKEISLYVQMLHTPPPQNRYEIKKLLRFIPQELFENLLTLQALIDPSKTEALHTTRLEAADIIQKGECYTLRNLAVNGEILAQAGISRGKTMGDILERLLDTVMQNPEMNTADILMRQDIIRTSTSHKNS